MSNVLETPSRGHALVAEWRQNYEQVFAKKMQPADIPRMWERLHRMMELEAEFFKEFGYPLRLETARHHDTAAPSIGARRHYA